MTPFLIVVALGVWLTLIVGLVVLIRETRSNRFTLENIESHQLNPRTRIAQAAMDNSAPSSEKTLRRVGAATRGSLRQVVGGEEDSQLYRDLSKVEPEASNG